MPATNTAPAATIDAIRTGRVPFLKIEADGNAGDFYGQWNFRSTATLVTARKAVFVRPIGMGGSQIAAQAALRLSGGWPITLIGSALMRTHLSTELQRVGYLYAPTYLTPHQVNRDAATLDDPGVLVVDLDGLFGPGTRTAAVTKVAEAIAGARAAVALTTSMGTALKASEHLLAAGADFAVVHG